MKAIEEIIARIEKGSGWMVKKTDAQAYGIKNTLLSPQRVKSSVFLNHSS